MRARAAAAEPAAGGEYRSFFGFSPRNAVWIVAQIHLMFGAFVLGVPIFASIVEVIGWRSATSGTIVWLASSRRCSLPRVPSRPPSAACLSSR